MAAECADESLVDDDIIARRLSGTLSFSLDSDVVDSVSQSINSKESDYLNSLQCSISSDDVHMRTGRPGPVSIRFEIINAKIEEGKGDKYILYTILVIRSAGLDSMPAKICKRYTDFNRLHVALRKRYPSLTRDVSFPPKQIRGNFKPETIASRSRAFEQYLSHLFSLESIRHSSEFKDFFFGVDMREGYRLVQNGLYNEGLPLLMTSWKLQTKLLGDTHQYSVATLCAVIACYAELDQDKLAEMYTETALECIGEDDKNPHLIPLLKLSIRLCWKIGKDKKQLEMLLQTLKDRGHMIDGLPSLLELAVKRYNR